MKSPKRPRKSKRIVLKVDLTSLTSVQRGALAATAARAGLGVSSWLRSVGLREAEKGTP